MVGHVTYVKNYYVHSMKNIDFNLMMELTYEVFVNLH